MIELLNFLDKIVSFSNVFLEVPCGGADVLKTIKFVWKLLDIVCILIPISLIAMVTLDFAKNVIAGKEDEMKKNVGLAIKRFIFCILIFFVEPLVHFTVNLAGENDLGFAKCINIAVEDDLSQYEVEFDEDDYKIVNPQNNNTKDKLNATIKDSDTQNNNSSSTGGNKSLTDEDLEHLNIYNQSGQYANEGVCSKYPSQKITNTACGLSVYMAARYALLKKDTKFLDFAEEACQTGFFNGAGTSWRFSEQDGNIYEDKYGIVGSEISNNYDTVINELKKGNVVVYMIYAGRSTIGEGGFNGTENQHFILLVSYRESDDKIYVYNPTGANTGWTSKDKIQNYVIDCMKLIRSMKAK